MNKRITSIVLSLVMLFTMLATAVPVLAATPVELKVTADTTSANPGDTINYKVSIGAVTDMGGLEFKLDIPSGLTVVDGSISIPDGLETIIDSDGPIIVPTSSNKYYWLYSAQLTGYTGTSDLVILTFSCKVDNGTTGTKTVSIKEVVLIDQSVDDMPFNVTGADVNVTIPHTHVYDQEVATAEHLKTAATCTAAAVYYKSCTCGENGTETFTSGSALGHNYTKKVENNTYLKTAASNCTEYNVYWYACSRCDANAKDDAEATDKYYTSTTAGNHSFTEKIEDAAHYVAGTGTDCQSVKKYYFDCAYCDQIGTTTWDSTTYGPHNYAATWSSDADGHWHECSLCHDKKDNEAHTPGAAATETTPQKCTECDYIITPALGHTHHMTPVAANPATCTEDGNKAYYVCSGCSKWFEDATGNVEITDHSSVVIEALRHDFAPATCTAPKTCSRCGATEGTPLGHDFAVSWSSDASGHWHACSRCDAKDGEATHTPDREAATETDPIKCTECDYIITPALVHTHTGGGGGSYYAPVVPDMPMLYRGCTGDAVKTLQDKLNTLGYNSGNVDGIFGAKTYAAVTAFQKANGLGVDGIVGKLTWGKLYGISPAMPVETTTVVGRPMVSYGSRGDAVRKLQELLNALGYDCGSVDGIFGSKTKAAVLAFQKANGLGVDGIVGPLTWGKLV